MTSEDDRIRTGARIAAAAFEGKTRDSGERFRVVKESAPQWVTDLVREAHGDQLPNDERYELIEDALTAIDDAEGEDLDSVRDSFADNVSVYTRDRTKWLAGRLDRYAYVDESVEEDFGGDWNAAAAETSAEGGGFTHLIALGMYRERLEVFDLVRAFLSNMTEDGTALEGDEDERAEAAE